MESEFNGQSRESERSCRERKRQRQEKKKKERVKSVVVEWRGNDNSPNDDFPFLFHGEMKVPRLKYNIELEIE